MYPKILFWKLDDADFQDGVIANKIQDIANRSVFDFLLLAMTWCKPKLSDPKVHDLMKEIEKQARSLGIGLALDIDVRPTRLEYLANHPESRLGIAEEVSGRLDNAGRMSASLKPHPTSDHYGSYSVHSVKLLAAKAFVRTGSNMADWENAADISDKCTLSQAGDEWNVSIDCDPVLAGREVLTYVLCQYDYPDIFSQELMDYHETLLEMYSDIPLTGITIDEWGAFPYPEFDFSYAWKRPWYSPGLAKRWQEKYGRSYIEDIFKMRFSPSYMPTGRDEMIWSLFTMLRESTTGFESHFYTKAKELWGRDAFIGVHPTWYAIAKNANTPELWKNGLNWWDVLRDCGQTDEIAPYPVRLALTHKTKGSVFYNMWYGMGTSDVATYWKDTWENLRYGGRTHYLGYECHAETPGVMELAPPGILESCSSMEELVSLANLFQRSSARSNVAIVMGMRDTESIDLNIDDQDRWDISNGVFAKAFETANDVFEAGWNCDLIPDYEIEDGDFKVVDGVPVYGNESYEAIIFTHVSLSAFLVEDFTSRLADIPYCVCDEPTDPVSWLNAQGIQPRDIPGGSRFHDGSVIMTGGWEKDRGNRLEVFGIEISGHVVDAVCEDAFGIALYPDGKLDRAFGGKLSEIRIDHKIVYSGEPEDVYIEMIGDTMKVCRVKGRNIIEEIKVP